MKVRIQFTVDVDEEFRRAIAARHGDHNRLATREEVRQWYVQNADSLDADLRDEYQREQNK